MFVPVFEWLMGSSAITAAVDSRIYWSLAPRNAAFPYIVLQAVSMTPESFVGRRQDLDYDTVSVHCWSDSQSQARDLASTCREVIGEHAEIVGGMIDDSDTDTGTFRSGFDIGDWTEL